jgi:hypothetical protein
MDKFEDFIVFLPQFCGSLVAADMQLLAAVPEIGPSELQLFCSALKPVLFDDCLLHILVSFRMDSTDEV